nr:MAG TPA: Bacterial type II and III secretion system protein [Caudoviricetes sp.]
MKCLIQKGIPFFNDIPFFTKYRIFVAVRITAETILI